MLRNIYKKIKVWYIKVWHIAKNKVSENLNKIYL